MKYYFAIKLFVLLPLLSVSMVSCQDNEEEAAPMNPAACKLVKTELTQTGTNGKAVLVA